MTVSNVWQVLYWGWVASEVYVAVRTRTRRGSGKVTDRGSMLILWVVIFASMTASQWIEAVGRGPVFGAAIFGAAHWLRVLSLCLMLCGLAIRWTAILTLGRSFSANVAIQKEQKVHREGLYRFVRHPSYSGLLLIFLSVGVHTRNWAALAIAVVPPLAALMYRIHVEEAALNEAFGAEYAEYTRETKRLVPGIY